MKKLILVYEQINRDIRFEDKQYEMKKNTPMSGTSGLMSPNISSGDEGDNFGILYSNQSSDSEDNSELKLSPNIINRKIISSGEK